MIRNLRSHCRQLRDPRRNRRGTTVVETAIVLPVFMLFMLGIIELGHAQMVKNVLRSACRQAARVGSTEGKSTDDVRNKVLQVLGSTVDPQLIDVYVKDAGLYDEGGDPPAGGEELESLSDIELSEAEPRQLFMVRAKVNYADIAIVPNVPFIGRFLDGVTIDGQAFMRHE